MNRSSFKAALLPFACLGLLAATLPGAAAPAKSKAFSVSDAARAAQIISAYRRSAGLGPVSVDPRLNAPAQQHAQTLAQIGTLSHGDFAGRVRSHGIRGVAAENLAYGSPDVGGAIAQWQGSAAHNGNLLMPQARRIGLARADGASTRFWVLVVAQ